MTVGIEVAVVGGGVIGCSIAFHLARRGVSVAVFERDRVGSHASRVAGGLLGHWFNEEQDSPFWRLQRASHDLHPPIAEDIRELTGYDVELKLSGWLMAADDEAQLAEFQEVVRRHSGREGAPRLVGRAELAELWPFADPRYIGGMLRPNDGQVNTPRFMRGLALAAERAGARIYEGQPAIGLNIEGQRVTGIVTSQGVVTAGTVVLAAGPWTGMLGQWAGHQLSIKPIRGQMAHFHSNEVATHVPVKTPNGSVIQRADGTILVGATFEDVGFDCRLTASGVASQTSGGLVTMPSLANCTFLGGVVGLRPQAPGELPVIGRLAGFDNLIVASGHFMWGILLAPVTGRVVSDLIVDGTVDPLIAPFLPGN